MFSIHELTDKQLINRIALLHKKAFPRFFLTQLGVPFLKTLYLGFFEDDESGIFIAEEDGELKGFLAYSMNYPRFFKQLIKKHVVRFAFCSLKAAVLHPSFIKRILGAFGKSDSVVKEERYVELASICVDPECGDRGIGTALIDRLKSFVDFNEYSYISLETDAENNEAANRFYQKNGFVLSRSYKTKEGRLMNEYTYKPGERI
ncbi:MAG: GNAT family N-acetyltransferase [Clostridia bacterium]|nr:GNAT family N-acetyltransferase [Clostridia bacterium]MBR5922781.1 GNAT family N-acetyltransferase [Clostridia bacterium]